MNDNTTFIRDPVSKVTFRNRAKRSSLLLTSLTGLMMALGSMGRATMKRNLGLLLMLAKDRCLMSWGTK